MAQGLSDYLIGNLLNHCFATGTFSKPTGHKLHLYKSDPVTGGSEVSAVVDDTAYAAQTITFSDEGAVTNNRVYNNATVTFAAVVYGSGAAAYNVTHYAVKDGSANVLSTGAFPATIQRTVGETLVFASQAIYIGQDRS